MTGRDEARDGGAAGGARGEGFPAVGYGDWRARVEEELGGAPFASLVSTLPGGVEVQPLYHQRPWGEGEDPRGWPGAAPFVRGSRPPGEAGGWLRCTRIGGGDPEAAKQALAADLRGGCDAAWLELDVRPRRQDELLTAVRERMVRGAEAGAEGIPIDSPEALAALIAGVDLERVALFLDAGAGSLTAAAFGFQALRLRGAGLESPRLFLGIDPIGALAAAGERAEPLEEREAEMAAFAAHCAAEFPRSRAVTVSAVPWHEAGATPVQELGWNAATLVRYLRRMEEQGLYLPEAVEQVTFRLAVGRDLFLGIAKLRALRRLWTGVLAACGVDPPPPFVHAVGSDLALTRRDPWTNLLRVTTEVFAAVAGGADAITAAAYDRLLPGADEPAGSRLGRRLARNAQHVLSEEAHLGRVADPAGGSYYVETLTEELARAAWEEMRRVEAAGGIAVHLRSGRLLEETEAAWRRRRDVVVEGSEPVLGVSVYPPADDRAAEPAPARRTGGAGRGEAAAMGTAAVPLPRHRLAEPFEDEGVAAPVEVGAAEGSE